MSETITASQPAPFSIALSVESDFAHLRDAPNVLAALGFANKAASLDATRPMFNVGLPLLAGTARTECWLSPLPVRYGKFASITYSENDVVLFGHLLLEEADFPDFRTASFTAYQHVFELLQHAGYPYLLRMWNYFPAITQQQGELNRYQTFCLGRQDALDQYGNFDYSPPAATAIGTQNAGLQVYFLAAKHAGMQLENPRQTSAFLYPRQYGPVSPAFSRATVKGWKNSTHVYISGTTSIVGHETLHIGNPQAQLDETLYNLEALLQHGAATLSTVGNVRELLQLKVYIHDSALFPQLKTRLDAYLAGSNTHVMYLHGDVCRPELMVEMEGIYA